MGGDEVFRVLVNRPNQSDVGSATEKTARGAEGNPRRKRKRLAFVIAHLGPGGAQRVAVNAANALVDRGFDIHIVVIHHRPSAYRVDPRVVIQSSRGRQEFTARDSDLDDDNDVNPNAGKAEGRRERGRGTGLLRNFVEPNMPVPLFAFCLRVLSHIVSLIDLTRRALWLRQRIKGIDPDAVLSFLTQTNILAVLATRGLNTHTVISERNDPRLQRHRPRVEFLRQIVYRWADVVTANSEGALIPLGSFVPKHKLAFLPNPLAIPSDGETTAFSGPTVITIGRLVEQKGIDVLLSAWAKVVETLPDWRLALVGDGPLSTALRELAAKLKIESNVDWLGHVSNPFPLLRGASFFVMTSRFEGTPNALLEAMACGLPAIVSDSSPGPCELVGTDENSAGLIVPVEDVSATADAIIRLARDESLRRRFGLAAHERVRAHDADHAIKVWTRLLRCE
jgi:GalNAc-alpha-(1->4)-GalNAc-alpha-(1->3)-diNAcBac-PP-undecaprenol alpha-1,4-N-acetyl-D-galactosaminyltransferase